MLISWGQFLKSWTFRNRHRATFLYFGTCCFSNFRSMSFLKHWKQNLFCVWTGFTLMGSGRERFFFIKFSWTKFEKDQHKKTPVLKNTWKSPYTKCCLLKGFSKNVYPRLKKCKPDMVTFFYNSKIIDKNLTPGKQSETFKFCWFE